MKNRFFASLVALLVFAPPCLLAQTNTARKELLQQMLQLFPKSEPWEAWLQKTGTLPPDFNSLPSVPFLPDPLRFEGGREVRTKEEWPRRRQAILSSFQQYVIGSFPASPGNVRTADIKSHAEGGAFIDEVLLEFGPDFKAKLHLELIIPRGQGPFPVFLTQDTHRQWAMVAVSRGYIGCVYAGADSRDDTEAWKGVWPEHDWTKLTRRAWAASRCSSSTSCSGSRYPAAMPVTR